MVMSCHWSTALAVLRPLSVKCVCAASGRRQPREEFWQGWRTVAGNMWQDVTRRSQHLSSVSPPEVNTSECVAEPHDEAAATHSVTHSLLRGWKCSMELWNLCVSCVVIVEWLAFFCNLGRRLAGWDCEEHTYSPCWLTEEQNLTKQPKYLR